MSKRREPRKELQTSVRIFGTDSGGKAFSEKVNTVNVSRHGVELVGVSTSLNPDETIGLTYANNRVHFRVKWVGKPETSKEGHVGLLNMSPEKPLWDFPLPALAPDNHRPVMVESRQNPRFRCQNSIELHSEAGASFWATIADLSVGGCYVEMALPFPKGSKVKVGIWIGETKIRADGEVAYSTPGLGIGIRFTKLSDIDIQRLTQFLETLGPFAKKR
jgi:PilZ domain